VSKEPFTPFVTPVMSGAIQWRRVVLAVVLVGTSESIMMRQARPVSLLVPGDAISGGESTSGMIHVSLSFCRGMYRECTCSGKLLAICEVGITIYDVELVRYVHGEAAVGLRRY
jgi:hypothetical protein